VLNYGFDRYGNLWSSPMHTANFTGGNNRMDGWQYNAAGDLTSDGVHTYVYDAENRLITASGGGTTASYVYDAEGRRVHETVNGVVKEYVYGTQGQELTVVDGSQNLIQGETYFDGRLLGTQEPAGFVWAHADELGTVRKRTNSSASSLETDTSWPFGENLNAVGGYSSLHFTGKYRDGETGLDNFGARYYSSALGRFMTPDWSAAPEAVPYANLENPQSLNLYNYVLNNPVSSTDRDGHWCLFGLGTTCSTKSKGSVKEVGGAAVAASGANALAELGDFLGELGGKALAASTGEFVVVLAVVNSPGSTDRAPKSEQRSGQGGSTEQVKAPGRPTAADGYTAPKRGAGARGELVKNPNGAGRGYIDEKGDVWVPTGEGPTAHGGAHWDVQSPGGGYRNVYPGGAVRPGGGGE
jgi:RHS repeat-associated protein